MAPSDQALLAFRAFSYRCALSSHAFRDCLNKFWDDLSFEEVAKFLDVPPSLLKYCLKMLSNYYGAKE